MLELPFNLFYYGNFVTRDTDRMSTSCFFIMNHNNSFHKPDIHDSDSPS